MGVLELTALPSIKREHWVPLVQETDALLVGGGDVLLSVLLDVAIGTGGPLADAAARDSLRGAERWEYGDDPSHRGGLRQPLEAATGSDKTLGLVDFTIIPHLDHPDMPDNSMANVEKWAAGIPVPAYAIDDQTAIKVIDGIVEVVSEGHWKRFAP